MSEDNLPASAILEPLFNYNGASYTKAAAAEALAAWDKNPDNRKAALAPGGGDKWKERAAFWAMARGEQPGGAAARLADGASGTGAAAVEHEADARELQLIERKFDNYARTVGLDEIERARWKRGLCTQEQKDQARAILAEMSGDPVTRARVVSGKKADAKIKADWMQANQVANVSEVAPADYPWEKDKLP
jgi:hypothetical protein